MLRTVSTVSGPILELVELIDHDSSVQLILSGLVWILSTHPAA